MYRCSISLSPCRLPSAADFFSLLAVQHTHHTVRSVPVHYHELTQRALYAAISSPTSLLLCASCDWRMRVLPPQKTLLKRSVVCAGADVVAPYLTTLHIVFANQCAPPPLCLLPLLLRFVFFCRPLHSFFERTRPSPTPSAHILGSIAIYGGFTSAVLRGAWQFL